MQNSHMRMSTDANSKRKRDKRYLKYGRPLLSRDISQQSGNAQLRVDHPLQSPASRYTVEGR